MASTSWGAPTLQFVPLTTNAVPPTGKWDNEEGLITIEADILLEGSTTLNTEEGETKKLKNARGNDVDSKKMPSSYTLETSIIRTKGSTPKFQAVNGIVTGDYAMRLIPEDPAAIGIQFGKCNIAVNKGWDENQGLLDILTVSGVQPNGDDKEICKEYTAQS